MVLVQLCSIRFFGSFSCTLSIFFISLKKEGMSIEKLQTCQQNCSHYHDFIQYFPNEIFHLIQKRLLNWFLQNIYPFLKNLVFQSLLERLPSIKKKKKYNRLNIIYDSFKQTSMQIERQHFAFFPIVQCPAVIKMCHCGKLVQRISGTFLNSIIFKRSLLSTNFINIVVFDFYLVIKKRKSPVTVSLFGLFNCSSSTKLSFFFQRNTSVPNNYQQNILFEKIHLDDELTTEEEKRDFDNCIEKALTQEFFFLQKRKRNTRLSYKAKRTNYVNKSKNKSKKKPLASSNLSLKDRLLSFGSYVAQEEIEDESLYKLLCWRIIKKKRRKNKDNSELSHNLKEEKNETSIG
ncbi:hypothetical protein RFI_04758 [Reticulomyxa filosa]|uniref:Uncharacterized protein n=1 Tax=Reticulomyxa filosa TaxID=46433 RepID=X6P2Q0_RETFI|nr:hypothetical protein RFI_04758 [Reticulomyxa filosa]|eukprot:ETO32359.1 hypothetical protein RFI_04758 [Reticulomyxa filosa]